MIIWINGSFGVGKTTIAKKLNDKINGSILYDPEEIGIFLANTLPVKEDDFQDYELWRIYNYEVLKYLSNKYEIIIVPMTITNPQYYKEIVTKLKNENIEVIDFILTASKENLLKRLTERKNTTDWTYVQIDRCIKAFNNNFEGKIIDTNYNNIDEVTSSILNLIDVL